MKNWEIVVADMGAVAGEEERGGDKKETDPESGGQCLDTAQREAQKIRAGAPGT